MSNIRNDDIWLAIRGKRWRLMEAANDAINASSASFHEKRDMKEKISEEIITKWNDMHNSLCELLQDDKK